MSHGYGPQQGDRSDAGGPSYGGYGSGGSTDRYTRPEPAGPSGGDGYVDPEAFGSPPLGWLVAAAVVAVVATVLAIVFGTSIQVAALTWLVAGPIAIGLLAVYAHRDTTQRARAVYSARSGATIGYWATAVVAMVGILVGAWRIAEWVGRL